MRRTAVAVLLIALALPAAATATKIVGVGSTANGKTARLHVGDILTISLPGEPGNGFRWLVYRVDRRVLLSGSWAFEASTADPDGPGVYTLGLRASKTGTTGLQLIYTPNGRRHASIAQFNLNVVVSKA